RRYYSQFSGASESTSVLAGSARVRSQAVLQRQKRILGFEDFDRRVSAVSIHRTHYGVAVVCGRGAPAAAFEVVVGVVFPCIGVQPAEVEVAGATALGSGGSLRRRLAQGRDNHVLQV